MSSMTASDNGLYPHELGLFSVKGTKGILNIYYTYRKTESSKISPQEVVSIAHSELDY